MLPLAAVALLSLTACTGDDTTSSSPSTSASASSSASATASASSEVDVDPTASTLVLDEAFCDYADQLYQRDLTASEALAAVDPSTLSSAQMADPDVFSAYIAAIDVDGWESWRALYLEAAENSQSAQMTEWIETIVAATDLQYEAYAEAAENTDSLTEWGEAVATILNERDDEIEVTGNEALNASEAALSNCGVPLSVPAGELLGYVG